MNTRKKAREMLFDNGELPFNLVDAERALVDGSATVNRGRVALLFQQSQGWEMQRTVHGHVLGFGCASNEDLYIDRYTAMATAHKLTQLNSDELRTVIVSGALAVAQDQLDQEQKKMNEIMKTPAQEKIAIAQTALMADLREAQGILETYLASDKKKDFGRKFFDQKEKTMKAALIMFNAVMGVLKAAETILYISSDTLHNVAELREDDGVRSVMDTKATKELEENTKAQETELSSVAKQNDHSFRNFYEKLGVLLGIAQDKLEEHAVMMRGGPGDGMQALAHIKDCAAKLGDMATKLDSLIEPMKEPVAARLAAANECFQAHLQCMEAINEARAMAK